MPGLRDLKTRIKSVQSTRKITRAMQMVSAAKMRKAQSAVLQSRQYAAKAWELIENVARQGAFEHPLINTYPEATKVGVILLSSNKGMVGSLNTNLMAVMRQVANAGENEQIAELVTYGKKGQLLAARLRQNISADFSKPERHITVEDIYPLAQFISEKYATGQYKRINIIYNHFVSTMQQRPSVKQLLPFKDGLRKNLESDEDEPEISDEATIYEPNPKDVVEHLIPRIIESQLYQAILESNASEHSARMVMMQNATEAAGDLIADYTLTYNQLRQNKITTELAEITAGKIALE